MLLNTRNTTDISTAIRTCTLHMVYLPGIVCSTNDRCYMLSDFFYHIAKTVLRGFTHDIHPFLLDGRPYPGSSVRDRRMGRIQDLRAFSLGRADPVKIPRQAGGIVSRYRGNGDRGLVRLYFLFAL